LDNQGSGSHGWLLAVCASRLSWLSLVQALGWLGSAGCTGRNPERRKDLLTTRLFGQQKNGCPRYQIVICLILKDDLENLVRVVQVRRKDSTKTAGIAHWPAVCQYLMFGKKRLRAGWAEDAKRSDATIAQIRGKYLRLETGRRHRETADLFRHPAKIYAICTICGFVRVVVSI
jgi:hypothetical protein